MTIPLPSMKQDVSALIVEWGVSCTIKRKASTRNAAGQVSTAFTTVGTEVLWIQPMSTKRMIETGLVEKGLLDKSYFIAHERYGGIETITEDRIEATGQTYAYDVLMADLEATHRIITLQQVVRK